MVRAARRTANLISPPDLLYSRMGLGARDLRLRAEILAACQTRHTCHRCFDVLTLSRGNLRRALCPVRTFFGVVRTAAKGISSERRLRHMLGELWFINIG